MLSQSGWGTRNGTILFGVAMVAACLAIIQLVRTSNALRWVLALTGFGAAGYAGYLLIQLYSLTQQLDGMTLAAKGPGLYVAAAGGALVFATIFLPLPTDETRAGDESAYDATPPTATRTLPGVLRPLGSTLRYPTALLGIVAGLAHVPVTPGHLQEARYIGVLFIAFTTVSLLSATLLLISDSLIAWTILAGSCLVALVAYVLSRTVGLPLIGDDVGNWNDPWGIVALTTETAVIILTAFTLARSRRSR
jgi:hypothetical protein